MTEQEELNEGMAALGQAIKTLDRLARRSGRKADDLCTAGHMQASADVRAMEASLRMAAAMATEAYAKGRGMVIPGDGGEISPLSGGK